MKSLNEEIGRIKKLIIYELSEKEEDSYEGAIVFDPVPQIDYEANSTKDYASLYPSSILHTHHPVTHGDSHLPAL